MKKQLKAALLSGLVFPGAGQISLHRYRRGIILIALVIAGVTYIIVTAARTALAIVQNLEMQGGDIDMATISRLAAQSSSSLTSVWYYGSLTLIVCCWLFGIIDAYRIGNPKPD